MKKETRCIKAKELRVTRLETGHVTLKGYAAVFNSFSDDLGGFREKIRPGAFSRAIDRSDCRALFNHNSDFILGRQSSGTLRLSEDDTGLYMEVDLPDTQQARDLAISVDRGDITQQSFGFTVKRDTWEEDRGGKTTIRTLDEIEELFDVSPVTFPAYPDTTVAKRSLEDHLKKDKNMKTAEARTAKLEKLADRLDLLHRLSERTDEENREVSRLQGEVREIRENDDLTEGEERILAKLDESYVAPPAGGQPGRPAHHRGYTGSEKDTPVSDKTFRGMFGAEVSRGGFRSAEEFLAVVDSGRYDERLQRPRSEGRAMTEGVGSDGGFSVPTEFAARWLDASLPNEVVRPRAQVWPMAASERQIPGWDASDRSGGTLFGGFKMEWLGEGDTGTKQNGKLKLMTMKAHKGAVFCQISNELRDDGLGFAQQLEIALVKSVGFGMDEEFFFGNGVAKPAGAFSAETNPALVTVAKEDGQVGGTITYANLTKMYARMAAGCFKNAVWMANQTAVPQLLSIYVPIGDSNGTHVPVLKENNGGFSIFGIPVVFSEHCKAIGTLGDIALVDWSQYAVGLRKEVSLDRSNAPGWTEDMTDYRVIVRVDGMSTWSDVITPLNGDTQSWCVALAERS